MRRNLLSTLINSLLFRWRLSHPPEAPEPELPPMTLDAYRALLAGIPLPTERQRDRFVDYVAHAHSWYKHLPDDPPGVPFTFYLDPFAGWALTQDTAGRLSMVPRGPVNFHYSSMETGVYLASFGHLSYAGNAGSYVVMINPNSKRLEINRRRSPGIYDGAGQLWPLPLAVVEAGTVGLTSYVHFHKSVWVDENDFTRWPEEAGGMATANALWVRHQQLMAGAACDPIEVDPAKPWEAEYSRGSDRLVYELAAPRRQLHHRQMRLALDRVCELAGGGG